MQHEPTEDDVKDPQWVAGNILAQNIGDQGFWTKFQFKSPLKANLAIEAAKQAGARARTDGGTDIVLFEFDKQELAFSIAEIALREGGDYWGRTGARTW
jgi:hypothetical protein